MFSKKADRLKLILGENSKITGHVESAGTILIEGHIPMDDREQSLAQGTGQWMEVPDGDLSFMCGDGSGRGEGDDW